MNENKLLLTALKCCKIKLLLCAIWVTITEDGKPFAEQVKGNYLKPGDDYSAEDAKVQTICAAVHTPEVIAAYQAAQEAAKAAQLPQG